MKIIKAMIKKHRTPEATGFTYPDGWDATKINVLAYQDGDMIGEVQEACIALIHDDDYAQSLCGDANVAVEEISEVEANSLGAVWRPQTFIIDDNKLPEMLVALAKAPEDRLAEEVDMLNPNSDAEGMRKTPLFDVRRWYPE